MNIQPLSKHLKTTTDTRELQNTLDHVADGLYRTDLSAEESIRTTLPYDQAIIINKLAAQEGILMNDKPSVQAFLQDIRKEVTTLPTVQITFASAPSATLITHIHDWFYRTYQKSVLLDVKVDPKIVAGCIISSKGKYYDFSVGKQAELLLDKAQ